MSKIQEVYETVEKGKVKAIQGLVQEALDAGDAPLDILNKGMIAAMDSVGAKFKAGEIFVPEMLVAAKCMKKGVEILKPHLASGETGAAGKVVIGTVAGDMHDIGKNLVALMLRNYGYDVIDLGKDVPADEIIAAAKEHNASIIVLSALMTTTMMRMKDTIALKEKEHLDVKVMIGGAVTTQSFADEIGADGYSADAADAVRLAKKLLAE